MTVPSRIRSWFRSFLQRSRAEREMDAELRFHIEISAVCHANGRRDPGRDFPT
jgi:hypothetical protein